MAAPLMSPPPSSPNRPQPLLTAPRSLTANAAPLKSPNATAAADLIRHLQSAMTSAQTSSLTAKDDAERARRNARAAGEVARRYGGKGKLKKKGGESSEGTERSLLEIKRERRSRARMAAEAKQRREYEMNAASWGGSPRGGWGVAVEQENARGSGNAQAYEGRKEKVQEKPRAQPQFSSVAASRYNYDSPVNKANAMRAGRNDHAAKNVTSEERAHDVSNNHEDEIDHGFGVSHETLSTTDGTVSTMEFEDALDEHSVNTRGHDDSHGDQQASGAVETPGDFRQNQYSEQHQKDGQYYYQTTGKQQNQNYYNQDESQPYSIEQSTWNAKVASTPTAANKSMLPAATPTSKDQSLEASNAEDVLTLSLELTRTREQLATTEHHLTTSQSHISTLQSHNAHLQSELNRLHSELESLRERSEAEIQSFQSKYNAEVVRATAAEEDANTALELANNADAAKAEAEEWLNRSVEEINLWKGRCAELERELVAYRSQSSPMPPVEEQEPKKLVRFADDSPTTSPVVIEDGGYHHETPLRQQQRGAVPPPPPPPTPASSTGTAWSTPQTTPNKSLVASGRAFLHRQSPGLSPHPKDQIKELLERTAETRRILKERLGTPTKQPPSLALVTIPRVASNGSVSMLNEGGFASRQGAACRSVGKTIRESGHRLKLTGKWWDSATKSLTDGGTTTQSEPVIEGVAELESMVREYCGRVESKIGNQNEKIEELLAFCDHLERELVNVK